MSFCPACRSEYRPGFDRCADCDVALIPTLPADPPPPSSAAAGRRRPVFSCTDLPQALVLHSLLLDSGFDAVLENEHSARFGIGLSTSAVPIVISVAEEEAGQAEVVLREHLHSGTASSSPEPSAKPNIRRNAGSWIAVILLVCFGMAAGAGVGGSSKAIFQVTAWVVIAGLLLNLARERDPGGPVPFPRIVLMSLTGVFGIHGIAALSQWLAPLTGVEIQSMDYFLVAAFSEEFGKAAIPVLIVAMVPSWRRRPFEWALVLAAAGAGFGVAESMFYSMASGAHEERDPLFLMLRSMSVLHHLFYSGFIGYLIGMQRSLKWGLAAGALVGLPASTIAHGIWNVIVVKGWTWLWIPVSLLYLWCMWRVSTWAIQNLRTETERRTPDLQKPLSPPVDSRTI